MSAKDVVVVVGSLRKNAYSQMTANALVSVAPPELKLEMVAIGDLPLYNFDLETSVPEPWKRLRERVSRSEALLFVTPEYNRSVPGVLKNAIDVGSRPYGQNAWDGKPAAVVSVTPGALGAFGANHHLRQSLVSLNVPVMPVPEAYIHGAGKLYDAEGKLTDEKMRDFFRTFMEKFAHWIEANAPVKAPAK